MHQESRPKILIPAWLTLVKEKAIVVVITASMLFLLHMAASPVSKALVKLGNTAFSARSDFWGIAIYDLAGLFNGELKEFVDQCYRYNAQQQYELAISSCNKAIEIDSNYATAYSYRGYAYLRLKKYDQAIADFSKDIELIPVATRSYINRGTAYMEQNQNDLAIAEFTKSIEINPKEPQAWLNRGLTYIKNGQSDLAVADCNKAIDLGAKYYNEYMCLGLAFINQQEYELAIANFNKAIDLAPNTMASTLYCFKGVAYAKNGDFESAIVALEQGLKLDLANENDWCKTAFDNAHKGIAP